MQHEYIYAHDQTSSASKCRLGAQLQGLKTEDTSKEIKLDAFWTHIAHKYKPKARMGAGSYGQVIKAKRRDNGQVVAIKHVQPDEHTWSYVRLLREITILKELSALPGSENISRLHEVICINDPKTGHPHVFLVLDYMPLTLFDVLANSDELHISEKDVLTLTYNLLKALSFLHEHNVMHRDIKPSNILVDHSLNVKICDFGLARIAKSDLETSQLAVAQQVVGNQEGSSTEKNARRPRRRLSSHVVSRFYRPPEVILLQKDYSEKVDLWSTGCIIQELILCSKQYKEYISSKDRIMFSASSCYPLSPAGEETGPVEGDLLKSICQVLGQLPEEQTAYLSCQNYFKNHAASHAAINFEKELFLTSKELIAVLEQLLQFNPSLRPAASELLHYPAFSQMRSSTPIGPSVMVDYSKYDCEIEEIQCEFQKVIEEMRSGQACRRSSESSFDSMCSESTNDI